MEEKKKPGRPLSVIYADAKQAITRQVGNTMAAYGLPIFMAEGILSGVLAEIRSNAANELADDTARYGECSGTWLYEPRIPVLRSILYQIYQVSLLHRTQASQEHLSWVSEKCHCLSTLPSLVALKRHRTLSDAMPLFLDRSPAMNRVSTME